MKNLIFIFFCFFINHIKAQELISPVPLQSFEARVTNAGISIGEFPGDFYFATDKNRILYATHYSEQFTDVPAGASFYDDVILKENMRLKVIDTSFNNLYEWGTGDYNNDIVRIGEVIFLEQKNDRTTVLGLGFNDTLAADLDFFILEFDSTLFLINDIWFNLPIGDGNISYISNPIKNLAGNFVIKGEIGNSTNPQNTEKFICEVSPNGQLIKYNAPFVSWHGPWLHEGDIAQMPNGYYILHPFYILDEDFNEVAYYDEYAMVTSQKIEVIDSSRFLFGGTGVEFVDGGPNLNYEAVCIADIEGNLDTIFYNNLQGSTLVTFPGFKATSAIDTNHIYFSTHTGGALLGPPTHISIHSFQLNASVNWSYYFGGDATYTPIDILTMPDGGCLLFVWKMYIVNNHWVSDIEYVRFDIDGNLIDLSTALQEDNFKLKAALLYPNPASDMLYIEHGQQLTQLQIVLVDALGKQVLSQPVSDKSINVNHLPVGNYFYSLLEKGALVQSGKVVIAR